MASPRVRKIADRIQVIVAEMLERRIKDPRLGFLTITDVRLTGDSQQATVFYTVLGDDAALAGTAAALESAKGVLRSEVGKQTGVRHTPSLTFVSDAVPETASHIEELLAKAAQAVRRERGGGRSSRPAPPRSRRCRCGGPRPGALRRGARLVRTMGRGTAGDGAPVGAAVVQQQQRRDLARG